MRTLVENRSQVDDGSSFRTGTSKTPTPSVFFSPSQRDNVQVDIVKIKSLPISHI